EIKVIRGDIVSTFRINGSIEPRNRLPIKPQIAGRIEEILVEEGQKVKKGEIIAWLSSTERAALLDIAKTQGEQEYQKWQEVYRPTPVIAPLDGFIIVRSKEPGQTVSTNDNIVVMADELIVKANIDETDLRYVKLNQPVEVSLDAYPEVRFTGIVEHIAYESTVVNNVTVYEIKIRPLLSLGGQNDNFPHNPPGRKKEALEKKVRRYGDWLDESSKKQISFKRIREYHTRHLLEGKNLQTVLRSGMTATVEVVAKMKRNVILVPTEAIINVGTQQCVLVKTEKKPQQRFVQIGLTDGKNVEIISGISEGEVILVKQKTYKKMHSGVSISPQTGIRRTAMSAFFRN
ncbi:MAG: efflux RND transporter periplasmic adaptor subunit, partial [Endomicrobia bacterium]|nr:efflux RND transporter periplasmic adaptor subunit [Endomicrobiia bacterium]